ncbi:MAG: glycoside hydrolase family 3 C-terminal domain-containing protein [Fibromonadaceae bacterium]|nr:glycoside hydrolase family 3 C-terminal domain-containing protein [Fibromonadaceae bacterium]
MRCFSLFTALLAASSVFAAPLNLTGTVKALNENGTPIENAVVLLKVNEGLVAYARTLSDGSGSFTLLPGKESLGEITHIAKPQAVLPTAFASYKALDLRGRTHSINNLPQGVYILLGKTENGRNINLGTVYHKGGKLALKISSNSFLTKSSTSTGDYVQLIVRKTGYLPKEVPIYSFSEHVGTVVLERDPLENRIDSVMALMSLDHKIYQMTQPLVGSYGNGTYLYGSVLHGGEGYSSTVISGQNLSSYSPKIPVIYGKDMMHGAAAISGATIFPHNIGMGATRDSALVRRACEVTAQESWAGGVDYIFGPAISVPQDDKWGRTYEGFGSTAELAVEMGAACIRGYQGEKYDADWRLIATAKHYLADGGVSQDRGNVTVSDEVLRAVHLPGYEAAVEQGVLSVMASFNQIRGTHQHVDQLRLTGWLKTELGFDGFIISDWDGIANSLTPGYTDACGYGSCVGEDANKQDAIKRAINAGIDMAMEPNAGAASGFISSLKTLVSNGQVSQGRIDDAVRRILRAKFRAGRMDNPAGISAFVKGKYGDIGSQEHRDIAREAVRKSLVLLKNENTALPISKTAKVFVTGSHANNHGYQCGGWTGYGAYGWQGSSGNISRATSIQAGFNAVVSGSTVASADAADVIVYVTGETPYAEWKGDISNLAFSDNLSSTNLAALKTQNPGKKIITVFISGRAMETSAMINNSDAFVAAWLPGSEGAGIADVLFGDHNFTGKLPRKWDNTRDYGFGLSN